MIKAHLLIFIWLVLNNSSFTQTLSIQEVSETQYSDLLKQSYNTQIFVDNNLIRKQDGKTLIKIKDKPTLVLEDINDKNDEAKNIIYSFKGFIDSDRTLLVFIAQEYESGYYLIINTTNGQQTMLWDEPIVNRNRNIIAVFSNLGRDIENMENGFQIVKLEEEQFHKYEYNMKSKYPENLTWINSNTLLMSHTDANTLKRGYLVITVHH